MKKNICLLSFLYLTSPLEAQILEKSRSFQDGSQIQASGQFVSLKNGKEQINAYGLEVSLWSRTSPKLDVGMGLEQVISAKEGGAAIISAVKAKARYHLFGGNLPETQVWTQDGGARVTQERGVVGGLSVSASLEQSSFNTARGSLSMSGAGLAFEYEKNIGYYDSLVFCALARRLSNGVTIVVPISVQVGALHYFQ